MIFVFIRTYRLQDPLVSYKYNKDDFNDFNFFQRYPLKYVNIK